MTSRGPLPASVYWRRRAMVLGSTLAVVLIVVNLIRGGSAPTTAPDAAALQSAEQTPSAAPTTPAAGPTSGQTSDQTSDPTSDSTTGPKKSGKHDGGGKKGAGKKDADPEPQVTTGPTEGPTQPVLVAPVGTCEDKDVLVTPTVADSTVGAAVPIQMVLRTKDTPACTWHLSAAHLAIKVSRLDNEIWSSRLCPAQIPSADVVVRQAVPATYTLDWSARRGETGCPTLTAWAVPGHYRVAASSLGGDPASSGFTLSPQIVDPDAAATTDKKSDGAKKASHT